MTSPPKGSTTQAAPWDRLRAWIDEKEAWERQHAKPASLTPGELNAISNLVSFVPEPDLGGKDHISALMQFHQARREDLPTFAEDGPIEMSIAGLKGFFWRYSCSLPSMEGVFPREGYGYQPGEVVPAFKVKKDAKQFAAQQALAYLEQKDQTHHSPSTSTPISKRPRIDPSEYTPSTPGLNIRSTTSSPVEPSSTPPKQSTEPSIFDCVARLAHTLGLNPPKYQIQPDEAIPDLWRGYAEFGAAAKVPSQLGLVTEVSGKQEAKALVAEKVLAWLKEENEGRQATIRELISQAGAHS